MAEKPNRRGEQRRGCILVYLTPRERLAVQQAAALTSARPATWARRELLQRADQVLRRAAARSEAAQSVRAAAVVADTVIHQRLKQEA